KQTLNINQFRKTFNSDTALSRTCRICECKLANNRHREKILNFSLEDAIKHKIYQAKRRDNSCALTFNDIKQQWDKQEGLCYYTGVKMSTLPNNKYYFSIDRYDSNNGYTSNNIVLCCNTVNIMKQSLSHSDFLDWCNRIVFYKAPL